MRINVVQDKRKQNNHINKDLMAANLHDNTILQLSEFAHIFFQSIRINVPWNTQNLNRN